VTEPTAPEIPAVPVAGLLVPADVVPQIVRGFRILYPGVTDGMGDEDAVQAVLLNLVNFALTSEASMRENQAMAEEMELVRVKYSQRSEEAQHAAREAAKRIRKAPKPTVPTTDGTAMEPLPPDVSAVKTGR